jgi:AcrR family transcriptional regulator
MIVGALVVSIEGFSSILVEQWCSTKRTVHAVARCVKIHRTLMPAEIQSTKRRYEKRARAAQEQATRRRIVEAALALHGTVGPARTTVSAIAERAGVRRATVYRHFPDERALFLGCSGAWGERHPLPDPATWAAIGDPVARLEAALDALYRWYEQAEPMLSAVLRDIDAVPMVAELQAARQTYLAGVEDGLVRGWGARGRAASRLRAAIALALDFFTWRTLDERGLDRGEATAVMTAAVGAAPRLRAAH